MVFKRRNPRSLLQWLKVLVWPRGGWSRAARYVNFRVRRLPDAPHRIARGIFAGVVISFTPLFGFHLFLAALIALVMRGNVIAALLATFVGNPITFPFIAVFSVELGHALLGAGHGLPAWQIVAGFGQAGAELWANIRAMFGDEVTHWERLGQFFHQVFLPYLVGGVLLGSVAGLVGYYLGLPLIIGYQKLRRKRREDRILKLRAARDAAAAANSNGGDDDGPGSP
ncbi:MAG: DUF2062 domain-containing protein [Pseudorhodobacter sp.]|nr:DUF2062 domain-containing protein [Pseudorhodobacter sp.]